MIALRIESTEGHQIDVEPTSIRPLGLKDLKSHFKKDAPESVRLIIDDGNCTITQRGEVSIISEPFGFAVEPNKGHQLLALVKGGWLPVAYAQKQVLFPDSNVCKNLSGTRVGIDDVALQPEDTLYFASKAIHPFIPAAEGNRRAHPSYSEFSAQMIELADKIDRRFPGRAIRPRPPEMYHLYQMVERSKRSYEKSALFLEWCVKNVIPPTDKQLSGRYRELTTVAKAHRISPRSFQFLLAVDSLYDTFQAPKDAFGPGRAVIKPKSMATESDAYNAAFDIWQLEFASGLIAAFGPDYGCLCTRDKGLAGAWCLFDVESISTRPFVTVKVSLPLEFARRMTQNERELFALQVELGVIPELSN